MHAGQFGQYIHEDDANGPLYATTALFLAAILAGCGKVARSILPGSPQQIRVAVIGGMVETGFWQALAERFQHATGNRYKIEVVAMGPKHIIAAAFRKGQADLITMHASDTIINLVADGYAVDPQPWLKNDLVIVGPQDDPAHIRGCKDAAEAFAKIASAARALRRPFQPRRPRGHARRARMRAT